MLKDLILKNRSYRRFHQDEAIDRGTLLELVDLARLSASGGNAQPLRYALSCEAARNALIFPQLAWAASLKDWPGPAEGERPSAYIIILGDTQIVNYCSIDHGIAAQSILLGATEKGFGGCMIGSINREDLREALAIDPRYEILLVIALGRPGETVQLEDVGPDGSTTYWRDAGSVHHVPKHRLDELVVQ